MVLQFEDGGIHTILILSSKTVTGTPLISAVTQRKGAVIDFYPLFKKKKESAVTNLEDEMEERYN